MGKSWGGSSFIVPCPQVQGERVSAKPLCIGREKAPDQGSRPQSGPIFPPPIFPTPYGWWLLQGHGHPPPPEKTQWADPWVVWR